MTPTPGIAFEDGRAVPSLSFDYDALDAPEPTEKADVRLAQLEAVRGVLREVCRDGAKPKIVGQRVLAMACVLGDFESQAALARSLGVSRQRVHALVDKARQHLAMLTGVS